MMGLIRWLFVPVVLSIVLLGMGRQRAEAGQVSVHVTPRQVRYYSPLVYTPHVYRHYAVPRYSHYPSTYDRPRIPVGVRVHAGPVRVHVFGGGIRDAYRPFYRYSYPTPIRGPRPIVRYHVW